MYCCFFVFYREVYRINSLCIFCPIPTHLLKNYPSSHPQSPLHSQSYTASQYLTCHTHLCLWQEQRSIRITRLHSFPLSSLHISLQNHGHVPSVLSRSQSHRPLQHLKLNTMQFYHHCIVRHLECKHSSCSLLSAAPTLNISYTRFTLGLLTSRLLIFPLFSLPIPLSSFFRLLFLLGANFKTVGFFLEVHTLLSNSATLFRRASSKPVAFLLTASHSTTSLAVSSSSFSSEYFTLSSAGNALW